MPKEMHPDRETFERIGFVFGDDVDDIFVSATLPAGWTREATSHSMHSDILDQHGRRRVAVFYKAAFYDRRADSRVLKRYSIGTVYPDGEIDGDALLPFVVFDGVAEIHRLGESRYIGGHAEENAMRPQGEEWLDKNRPGWRGIVESWRSL